MLPHALIDTLEFLEEELDEMFPGAGIKFPMDVEGAEYVFFPAVSDYLLEADSIDARLRPYAHFVAPQARLEELRLPADLKRRLNLLVRGSVEEGLLLYFQGGYGLGKQSTAEALSRELGQGLLVVDGEQLLQVKDIAFDTLVRLVIREARLCKAVLYWTGFEALLARLREAVAQKQE